MKTNLHILNFGKIKSANIQLRPFTVIVGPNSSGKSLITKSLYSIFHSMSQNLMGNPSLDSVSILQFQLNLKQALLSNFQIKNLKQLHSYRNNCDFYFSDCCLIEFKGEDIFTSLNVESMFNLRNVVYLESPDCFKLNQTLRNIQHSSSSLCGNDFLNQPPKYFDDLAKLIKANATADNREFLPIIELIERKVNGSFNVVNGEITFTDYTRQDVETPLSMVSSGILNLGLIALLMKQNVLSKGGVLIIDAPESNLHPEWQHFMLDVLVELSKLGVMVVTTTHSLDVLYRLEHLVSKEKELALNEHFGLNRLTQDGTSISSYGIVTDIRRAKEDLGRHYIELMKERLPL